MELAAARTKILSPGQILERLRERLPLLTGGPRDAPARQQTLRNTIEWSYELLSPDEQRLFARFSVFAGGCTLEAAEEVAGIDLDLAQSFVDRSLVRRDGERLGMLETIREYAHARLEAAAETDDVDAKSEAETLRLRHLTFFTAFAERATASSRARTRRTGSGGYGPISRMPGLRSRGSRPPLAPTSFSCDSRRL